MPSNVVTLDYGTHTYTDDAGAVWPGVTSILKSVGMIDSSFYTQESRDRGELVHEITYQIDVNGLLTLERVPEFVRGYCAAWMRFKSDSGFDPADAERTIWHNTYKFAGTLDRTGVMNGDTWIIDIKTGQRQPWWPIQLAAYQSCLAGQYKRASVELSSDGKYKLHAFNNPRDFNVFLSALAVLNWRKSNGL